MPFDIKRFNEKTSNLFSLLVGKKRHKTSFEVNEELVIGLLQEIRKNFEYKDIDCSKADHVIAVRKFLKNILIVSTSVIVKLNHEIILNFLVALNVIFKNPNGFLTAEEAHDYALRLANSRTPLLDVNVPFSESMRKKIKEKGRKSSDKHSESDMFFLLQKIVQSRQQNSKFSDREIHECLVFFITLFTREFPSQFLDVDIDQLLHHMWPPRIREIKGLEGFCRDYALDVVGHQHLSKNNAHRLCQNAAPVTIEWTDDLSEELNKKRCRNATNDVLRRVNAIEGIIHFLQHADEERSQATQVAGDDKGRWHTLISLIKIHCIEGGTSYCFFTHDVAELLVRCYDANPSLASKLYRELLQDADRKNCITAECVTKLQNWTTSDIITEELMLAVKNWNRKDVESLIIHLASQNQVRKNCEFITLFWKLFSAILLGEEGSADVDWFDFLVRTLNEIILLSCEMNNDEFYSMIGKVSLQLHEKSFAIGILKTKMISLLLTVAYSMTGKTGELENVMLLLNNVMTSPENVDIEEVSFITISNILASQFSLTETDLTRASLTLLAVILKQTNSGLDAIIPDESCRLRILKGLVEISTTDPCLNSNDILRNMAFWILMRMLVKCKTLVAASFLEPHTGVLGFLEVEIFSQEMQNPRVLQGVVEILMQPNLIEVGVKVLEKLFQKLFDEDVAGEDKYLGDMFCQFARFSEEEAIHEFYNCNTMKLMMGFNHKFYFIRDPCVKIVSLIHGLNPREQVRLMQTVNGCGSVLIDSIHSGPISVISNRSEEKDTVSDIFETFAKQKSVKKENRISREMREQEIARVSNLKSGKHVPCARKPNSSQVSNPNESEIPMELRCHVQSDPEPLIETETMLTNLDIVMNSVRNPTNLLLEGSTGIGKTAVVLEAARRLGKPVIRCNMCANTTMANVFGSAVPIHDGEKMTVSFKEGPFTLAFRAGAWLLLDEMNLAPERVLSCIENALDLGILFLPTESAEAEEGENEGKRSVEYRKHADFRLFCTQNPNTGHYKGRREAQSAAMLSRYTPVTLHDPTLDEVKTIIRSRFERKDVNTKSAHTTARLITETHDEILKSVSQTDFTEGRAPYAEITLRDAMRWADRVEPELNNVKTMTDPHFSLLAKHAWDIYGARFREEGSRSSIRNVIQKQLKIGCSEGSETTITFSFDKPHKGKLQINELAAPFQLPETDSNDPLLQLCHSVYARTVKFMLEQSCEILPSLGPLFFKKMIKVCDGESKDYVMENCLRKIYRSFLSLSRSEKVRGEISTIFCKSYEEIFKCDGSALLDSSISLDLCLPSVCLTSEMKQCWTLILRGMKNRQPVLVTGASGCGKSQTIGTLANVLHQKVLHLHISPQTEPEVLVGSFVPKKGGIEWQDGLVTEAVKNGYWLVLENLSEAPSTVLERLNSVLETPASWTVSENSKEPPHAVKVHENFRILATMTPPAKKRLVGANMTTNSELSPALYNRFSIIHMSDALLRIEDEGEKLFASLVGDSLLMEYQSEILRFFRSALEKKRAKKHEQKEENVSMRLFTRTVDGAYKLHQSQDLQFSCMEALKTVISLNMDASSEGGVSLISPQSNDRTASVSGNGFEALFSEKKKTEGSHVIDEKKTPSQFKNARLLTTAILCNYPSLLEGPAATGKTSLVAHLAECFNRRLERVNNTDNTSITDYLGSFLPDGSFAPGPLVRAMREGSFFLADEFDLAEPAILNMLYPLLEGHGCIMVPGRNRAIVAHENFRFFATQNGFSYAGRKELPMTLRSRFTEISFTEFSSEELEFIIKNKKCLEYEAHPHLERDVQQNASNLAKVYTAVNAEAASLFGKEIKMTMREITKWIRRRCAFPDCSWGLLGFQLFYPRVAKQSHKKLAEILLKGFPDCRDLENLEALQPQIAVQKTCYQLNNVSHPEQTLDPFLNRDEELWNMLDQSSPSFLEHLWNMCVASTCQEPVLLVGPTSCKSHLVDTWCRLNRREDAITVLCNRDSDSADFIGRLRPYTFTETASLLGSIASQFVLVSKNETDGNDSDEDVASKFLKNEMEKSLSDLMSSVSDALLQMSLEDSDPKPSMAKNTGNFLSSNEEIEDGVSIDSEFEHKPSSPPFIPRDSDSDFEILSASSTSSDETPLKDSDEDNPKSPDIPVAEDNRSTSASSLDTSYDLNSEAEVVNGGGAMSSNHSSILGGALSRNSSEMDIPEFCRDDVIMWSDFFTGEACSHMSSNMEKFVNLLMSSKDGMLRMKCESLEVIRTKFDSILSKAKNISSTDSTSQMIFLFQDGPCTQAVKENRTLVLEDIDLPSQAVSERLNSLLETEPFFSVFEDLTIGLHEDAETNPENAESQREIGTSLKVFPHMGLFATAHVSSRKKLKLSPAIRSRMSEIVVTEYSDKELIAVSRITKLQASMSANDLEMKLLGLIERFRNHMNITAREMRTLGQFIEKQMEVQDLSTSRSFMKVVAFGIIFLWVDRISFNETTERAIRRRDAFVKTVLKTLDVEYDDELRNVCEGIDDLEAEWATLETYGETRCAHLAKSSFRCKLALGTEKIEPLTDLCVSKTTYRNMARVFAAAQSGMNLLLNGPPGIGKTKIIECLSAALGFKCLRINLSANTTYEDLIGSFIPRMVKGKRQFEFVKGALLKALEDSECTWILLDEVNLAQPQLLEKLLPILARHSEVRLDATGEVLELKQCFIFATKNPENVGGGRNKMPASIESRFLAIDLTDFSSEELRKIAFAKFLPESPEGPVSQGCIPQSQVSQILAFHSEVARAANAREVGIGKSGVCFNLRDIEKFIRAAETNSEFHRLSAGDLDKQSNAVEIEGIRLLLDLIYTKRLSDRSDKEKVRSMIDKFFPSQMANRSVSWDCDESLHDFVRIGFIYLKKGCTSIPRSVSFSLTEEMAHNLVELAAATRTGLTILLQGGTASGKTTLVVELARMSQQKLVVFQMNEDTTVSDLLGAWTVSNSELTIRQISERIRHLLKGACQLFLRSANHALVFDDLTEHFRRHKEIYEAKDVNVSYLCKTVEDLLDILRKMQNYIPKFYLSKLDELTVECTDIWKQLENIDYSSSISFSFVEGPLVEAARKGKWVLLDNIGQAPGDVLERLNPLAEAEPQLTLIESSSGEILTRERGLHPNFRLFASNNTERNRQNELSSAFRNRCIDIHLPALDEISTNTCDEKVDLLAVDVDAVKSSPAHALILHELKDLPEKDYLTNILCLVHFNVKRQCRMKTVQLIRGYELTYRNLRAATEIILYRINNEGENPLSALTSAVLTIYCNPTVTEGDKQKVLEILFAALRVEKILFPITPTESQVALNLENDEDLSMEATRFVLNAVHGFLSCLSKVMSECSQRRETQIFENIMDILQKLLNPLIQNEKIIFESKKVRSVGLVIVALIRQLQKSNILTDSFADEDFSGLQKQGSILIQRLKVYVGNCSFSGAKRTQRFIQSIRSYLHLVSNLGDQVKMLCDAKHFFAANHVFRSIKEVLEQFKILDLLFDYSKEMTTCGHQEFTRRILDELGLVKESDPLFQRMSFAVSAFERALSLPIVGNEDHREHAVAAIFAAFPHFNEDKGVQLILSRMEMLVIKLTVLQDTPDSFLIASMNDKISRVALANLNAYHILSDLLNRVTEITDKVMRLKESYNDTEDLDEAVVCEHGEEKANHLATAGKEVDKLRRSINDELKKVMELKYSEEAVQLEMMQRSFLINGRQEMMNELSKNTNVGELDRECTKVAVKTSNKIVPMDAMLDIVAFFDLGVLPLINNGLRVKVGVLEAMKNDKDLEEFLFNDLTVNHLIFVSLVDGSLILIDSRRLATMSVLKVQCFSPSDDAQAIRTLASVTSICNTLCIVLEKHNQIYDNLNVDEISKLLPPLLIMQHINFETEDSLVPFSMPSEEELVDARKKIYFSVEKLLNEGQESSQDESVLLTVSEKLNQVFNIVEETENESLSSVDLDWLCKRLMKLRLYDHSEKVSKEYSDLKEKFLSTSIDRKANLLRIIEDNEDQLKWMHVFESLKEVVDSLSVRQLVSLSNVRARCLDHLNKLLMLNISNSNNNWYELLLLMSRTVLDNFQSIRQLVDDDGCSLKCSTVEFCKHLENLTEGMVSFVRQHFQMEESCVANEFSFNYEVVHDSSVPELSNQTLSFISMQSKPVNEKTAKRIEKLRQRLDILAEKIKEKGIRSLCDKIAEKMLTLKNIDGHNTTDVMLKKMTRDIDELEQEVSNEIDLIAEEEKEHSLRNMEGIVKVKPAIPVEVSSLETLTECEVTPLESESHEAEINRLLQTLPSPVESKSVEEIANTARILLKLRSIQRALEHVSSLISNLNTERDFSDLSEKLLPLKKIIDDPHYLLLVNKIPLDLQKKHEEKIPLKLTELFMRLKEERRNALTTLSQMQELSIDQICSFVSLFAASAELNVGEVWSRVQQLKELQFELLQMMKSGTAEDLVLKQENTTLFDFIAAFCPDNDEECASLLLQCVRTKDSGASNFDEEKLKTAFSAGFRYQDDKGSCVQFAAEPYVSALREHFTETVSCVQALQGKADSPSSEVFRNFNFLAFILRQWNDVTGIVEALNDIEVQQQKEFLRGESSVDYETRIATKREELKRAQKLTEYSKSNPDMKMFEGDESSRAESESSESCGVSMTSVINDCDERVRKIRLGLSELMKERDSKLLNEWNVLTSDIKSFGEQLNSVLSQSISVIVTTCKEKTQTKECKPHFEEWLKRKRGEILRFHDCRNESKKQAIAKCYIEISEMKKKVVEMVRTLTEKMKNIVGLHSPLFYYFLRLINFSVCVISSLSLSLKSVLTILENDSREQAKLVETFLLIQGEVVPFADKVLSDEAVARGRGCLTTEEMNELVSQLKSMEKLTSDSSFDFFNITVEHARSFIARLLAFCLGNKESAAKYYDKTDYVLEVLGLPALPCGEAQLSSLLDQLVIEYSTLPGISNDFALGTGFTSATNVSLLTLLDALQAVDKIFGRLLQQQSLVSNVKDLTKKKVNDALLNLINVSVLCNAVLERIVNLAKAFKKTTSRLTRIEINSLKSVFSSLRRILRINGKDRMSHVNPLKNMISKLSEMTKDVIDHQYGCIELQMNVEKIRNQMQTTRPKLDLTELVEYSQNVSSSLAALTLDYYLYKMGESLEWDASVIAGKDKLLSDYLESHQSVLRKRYLPSAMIADFCFIGIQEIANISCKTFEEDHSFQDCHSRFEKTILHSHKLVSEVEKFLNFPKQKIKRFEQESLKFEDMDGVKEILSAAQMFEEGKCQWKLSKAVSMIDEISKGIQNCKELLSDLRKLADDWDGAVYQLLTWRKDVCKKVSSSRDKDLELLAKENEEKRQTYARECEIFNAAVREAKIHYSQTKESLLLCFMRLFDEQKKQSKVPDEMHELKSIMQQFLKNYDLMVPHFGQIEDPLLDSFEREVAFFGVNLLRIHFNAGIFYSKYIGVVTYGTKVHKWHSDSSKFDKEVVMVGSYFYPPKALCKEVQSFKVEILGVFESSGRKENVALLFDFTIPFADLKQGLNKEVFPAGEGCAVTIKTSLIVELKPKHSALENLESSQKEKQKCKNLISQVSECRSLVHEMQKDAEKISRGPPKEPVLRNAPTALDETDAVPKIPLYERMSETLRSFVSKIDKNIEELEVATVELQQVVEIIIQEDVAIKFDPNVIDLSRKLEAEIVLLNSLEEFIQSVESYISELKKEEVHITKEVEVVKEDKDLYHNPWFTSFRFWKSLRPIETVISLDQKTLVSRCIQTLIKTKKMFLSTSLKASDAFGCILNFFVFLCNDSNDAIDLSLQLMQNCKNVKSHDGQIDALHTATQKKRNNLEDLRKKIEVCTSWTLNDFHFSFSNVKFVPQRLVTMEIQKSSTDNQLTCSYGEIDLDLGVFVKNFHANEPPDHHIRVHCANFKCSYKVTGAAADSTVFIRPTDQGFADDGEYFECKFVPDEDTCDVGVHKATFSLQMSDVSSAQSCEVQLRVNFLIENFRKNDIFPDLPFQEDTSLLDLGKTQMSSKVTKSFVLKNPLGVPLRLKIFPEEKRLVLDQREVILAPHQQIEQKFSLDVARNEGQFNVAVRAYYSASLFHVLSIIYVSCRMQFEILNDREKIPLSEKSITKVFDKTTPAGSSTWSGLRIRNLGSLPLRLKCVQAEESPHGEIEVTEQEISESKESVVQVHIHPKEEGKWTISSTLVLSTPHEKLRELKINVVVKSQWPKLEFSPPNFEIQPKFVGTQMKRTLFIKNVSDVDAFIKAVLIEDAVLVSLDPKCKLPVRVAAKEKLELPIIITPGLRGGEFTSNLIFETNCKEKFQTLSVVCSVKLPELDLLEELFDIGVLGPEVKKETLSLRNRGEFASVKVECRSAVPDVTVSKHSFTLRESGQDKITFTVASSERPPANGSTFFHSRLLFKQFSNNTPFATKTAWVFGLLEGIAAFDGTAPGGTLQGLDKLALCELMTTAKTTDFKLADFLSSLAFAALLNDDQAAFGEILENLRNNRVPSNLTKIFETVAKRSPSSEEAEILTSCENAKKTMPVIIKIFNEFARTNEAGLLFRNALSIRFDFRWKKGADTCHLLDGMEGAMGLCQSFVQKINPEASQKITALASAIREAKIQPVHDNLKVFCALALCLKSSFFRDPCAFSVGVLLESCIQAVRDERFDCENICKMIAVRQAILDRQSSYPGKNVAVPIQSIEKVLSKPPNWGSDQEAASALTKISKATFDLMDSLRPEPNARESRIIEALCFALSTNPVTAALGCVTLCSEASLSVEENQEEQEKNSDLHILKDEEKDTREELGQSDESEANSLQDIPKIDTRREDEFLGMMPSEVCSTDKKSNTVETERIVQMISETLREIDEDFDIISSALKETNGVRSIHLDSLITVLNKASNVVLQLHRVIGAIFQRTTWSSLSKKLPDSVLNRIVTTCGRLYQILQVFEREWKKKKVKGKFSDHFCDLKGRIEIAAEAVLESMMRGGGGLREQLKESGLKLTSQNVADFEVKMCSFNSFQAFNMIERSSSRNEATTSHEFDVEGHLVVKEAENRKYFTDGTDPFTWMEGGGTEDSVGLPQCKLVRNSNSEKLQLATGTMSTSEQRGFGVTDVLRLREKSFRSVNNKSSTSRSLKKRKVQLTARQIEMMRQRCKNEMKEMDTVHDVADYRDPERLPEVEQDELKYLLLARITKGAQSKALAIMTRTKDENGRKRAEVSIKQEYKFVFLVDNSGSMFGDKMTLALTLLVVLLETMKRLEFATAVVRFGGEESQNVLKGFTDKMDAERGQYILESFDSSEKTLAADAVKFVASHKKLYGKTPERHEHRFIVLITDGIWSQSKKGAYERYLSRSKASMMILTTNPNKDKDLDQYNLSVGQARKILDSIAPGTWFPIDAQQDLLEQVGHVATILDQKIRDILFKVATNEDAAEKTDFEVGNLSMVLVPQNPPKSASLQYTTPGVIEWGTSVYASHLQNSQVVQTIDENLNASIWEKVDKEMEAFASETDMDEKELGVDSRAKIITEKENDWATFVSDLNCVLDTSVLPNNQPTRAMQDYHGPSFSLRGFIRFICTDGQYKKIYENVIGHPRKDYCVSVVLDTSTSMCGMTAVGSIQAFIGLSAALHESGVSFGLLTAGTETELIKDLNEEWGPVAKARAHAAMKFEDKHSNVADAILYASHLVQQNASSKTLKIVLVITDGFDSAPKRLRQSLSAAEAQDVMVVGIGIGYFTEAVFDHFSHYVVVNDPKLLPQGLHRLFSGEGSSERPLEAFIEEDKQVKLQGQVLSTAEEVWNQEMREVYDEIVQRNRAALYLAVGPIRQKCRTLSLEVCFVMDTTGSMGGYIHNAQQYIVTMANDTKANVAKFGREADLKMAFVSYKFFGNEGHQEHHPFSDNLDSVMTTVNRMRATGGHGNEDKFGGLMVAMNLEWRAAAKFLVLIGDMPDHILHCPGCYGCFRYRQNRSEGGILELVEQVARERIYLLYVKITRSTREEEVRVEKSYRDAAPADMEEKGFTLLDMMSPGAADTLMSKISDFVDEIIAEEFM